MGVTFGSKPATQQPQPSAKAASPKQSGSVWYKRGSAAAQEIADEDQRQQEAYESSQRMFRFRIKNNEEARITFIDGNLDDEGLLDIPVYREHHLFMSGRWGHFFTCTNRAEPCPICEGGDEPSLVSALTIIDHRSFKTKAGIEIPYSRKLFVCKRPTHKLLQSMAAKRGGLAGCTFDVMRSGENSANVGSNFDFVQRDSIEDLVEHFTATDDKGQPFTLFTPADYEIEIPYYTAEQLRERGFGKSTPIGAEKPLADDKKPAGVKFANKL